MNGSQNWAVQNDTTIVFFFSVNEYRDNANVDLVSSDT